MNIVAMKNYWENNFEISLRGRCPSNIQKIGVFVCIHLMNTDPVSGKWGTKFLMKNTASEVFIFSRFNAWFLVNIVPHQDPAASKRCPGYRRSSETPALPLVLRWHLPCRLWVALVVKRKFTFQFFCYQPVGILRV